MLLKLLNTINILKLRVIVTIMFKISVFSINVLKISAIPQRLF